MNAARATLNHSQLLASHWEDAVRGAAFKYNHIMYHDTGQTLTEIWNKKVLQVPIFFVFVQLGSTPVLANRDQISKLESRSNTIRYLYASDLTHIVVFEKKTGRTRSIRTVNFRPCNRSQDPTARSMAAFKAFLPHPTPNGIITTTPARLHHGQAKRFPDAREWEIAHNSELENID